MTKYDPWAKSYTVTFAKPKKLTKEKAMTKKIKEIRKDEKLHDNDSEAPDIDYSANWTSEARGIFGLLSALASQAEKKITK
ncbi:hypothetical protein [Nitrospira sp. BLG_2]|uniref:hypothetical protein n=1 Tax=Nitrospira sp. BLG_2 TaxID=3397507 RepID=UPI003B99E821